MPRKTGETAGQRGCGTTAGREASRHRTRFTDRDSKNAPSPHCLRRDKHSGQRDQRDMDLRGGERHLGGDGSSRHPNKVASNSRRWPLRKVRVGDGLVKLILWVDRSTREFDRLTILRCPSSFCCRFGQAVLILSCLKSFVLHLHRNARRFYLVSAT